MLQTTAKIIANQKVTPKYYRMTLNCAAIARKSSPGQFINIDVASKEVFLRRPFSICNVNGDKLEIIYKVIGPGTEALAAKKKNESLNIIGPLGNGYNIPEMRVKGQGSRPVRQNLWRSGQARVKDNKRVILVAGGTGVASLFFLAKKLKSDFQITVLVGTKTKNELVNIKEFKQLGLEVKVATDDGSAGYKGLVSGLLHKVLGVDYKSRTTHPKRFGGQADDGRRTTGIYACGPKLMLKEIALISKNCKIPCQVSLEEHMSCGVGACMGCVAKIKTKNNKFEYKRVCKEGPVFEAQEVVWE
ncbi:MAG: dihydroorotate dehydrogenase electron transfer subunit [bacterium]